MKTKLLISLILAAAVTAFIFNKPSAETELFVPPPAGGDEFIYGAISTLEDGPNYANYDQLELGAWHTYVDGETGQFVGDPDRLTPVGPTRYNFWPQNDHLMTPVSEYASELTDIIDDIYSHNNSRILWQRPKIEWLAYGQSSNYQAENISNDHRLWFYSFQTHIGETQQDFQYNNGDSVLYCGMPTDGANAKFILKGLKANTEQCRKEAGINDINQWHSDHQCDWYIKPRIRIPSNLPYENENLDVCKIKVIAQDGQTVLKETIIKAGYFKDNQHPYTGQYIENFFFPSGIDLIIHGDWLGTDTESKWVLEARGNRSENEIYNHADIQVWWYDNCYMWIDYVRVDSDVANDLLSTDPNNTWHQTYLQWIEEETAIAMHLPQGASDPAVWKFYVELTEFNNLPCINYLNERIRIHSLGKIDFIADFCERLFFHINWPSLPTISSPQWIYDNYIQRGGFSAIYGGEAYAMTSRYYDPPHPTLTFSKIPETLPRTTCNGEPFCGLLSLPTTPENYDDWLQDNFNHSPFWTETGIPQEPSLPGGSTCYWWDLWQNAGKFRYVMKTFSEVSKIGNIPFIFMPQAHLWYTPGETEREPTNEELEMVANLAISYGTHGLMWWSYGGFDDWDPECPKHGRGLTNPGNELRTNNYYNQAKNKWEVFRDIGRRIRIWEPYLMSFTNTDRHSYIYHDERTDLINETYFKDIVTYKPGSGQPSCVFDDPGESSPPNMVYECYEERYVQVAVFKKPSTVRNELYFMIVNRRCSPVKTGYPDGIRYIRIALDANSSSFPVYRTWKIFDIAKEDWGVEFDKTTGSLIDLGYFEPGEGKLYKIVPVY